MRKNVSGLSILAIRKSPCLKVAGYGSLMPLHETQNRCLISSEAISRRRRTIGVERVLLKVALCVVDADRPEGVNRHVLDGEPMERRAVILVRRDVEIEGIFLGIAAEGEVPIKCRIGSTRSLAPTVRFVSGGLRLAPKARRAHFSGSLGPSWALRSAPDRPAA
jgi:hypothetical protein